MVETFGSYPEFIERVVLPTRRANPSWTTLNGGAGSSRRAAAQFLHDGIVWKVDEDSSIDNLLAPYDKAKLDTKRAVLELGTTALRQVKSKNGTFKTVGGKPKLQPAVGCGSSNGFYVYFHRKA